MVYQTIILRTRVRYVRSELTGRYVLKELRHSFRNLKNQSLSGHAMTENVEKNPLRNDQKTTESQRIVKSRWRKANTTVGGLVTKKSSSGEPEFIDASALPYIVCWAGKGRFTVLISRIGSSISDNAVGTLGIVIPRRHFLIVGQVSEAAQYKKC